MKFRFLLNAILIAIIIAIGLDYWQSPPLGAVSSVNPAQIAAVKQKILPVQAGSLVERLKNPEKQHTLVFLYASWCPYCKRQFPLIERMIRESHYPNVIILPISVDAETQELAEFLAHRESLPPAFIPYQARDVRSLALALRPLGSHFQGSIPYLGIFDDKGNLIQDFMGFTSQEKLDGALGQDSSAIREKKS